MRVHYPEMRIWSILLNTSDYNLVEVSIFQLLGGCQCWLTSESPKAHVAKFYGRLWLICSVLRASYCIKLIEIVILWVDYTIPFSFSLFWHFRVIIFNF